MMIKRLPYVQEWRGPIVNVSGQLQAKFPACATASHTRDSLRLRHILTPSFLSHSLSWIVRNNMKPPTYAAIHELLIPTCRYRSLFVGGKVGGLLQSIISAARRVDNHSN